MSKETQKEWNERSLRPGLPSVMSLRWDEERSQVATSALKEELLAAMGNLEGRKLLEIGCGIGRLTPFFQQSGADIVAVDYSMGMLRRASGSIPTIPFINATAAALPLSSGSFDSSVAVTVLQHIVDPDEFENALAEIQRVTRESIVICDELRLEAPERVSPFTLLRTIDMFEDLMPDWRLAEEKQFTCISDLYTIMRWEK